MLHGGDQRSDHVAGVRTAPRGRWLAGGSIAVWVVYLEEQEVRVFVQGGTSYTRLSNEALTVPELLPGWELPVAKLFED